MGTENLQTSLIPNLPPQRKEQDLLFGLSEVLKQFFDSPRPSSAWFQEESLCEWEVPPVRAHLMGAAMFWKRRKTFFFIYKTL